MSLERKYHYDPVKRAYNLAKHGLDFDDLDLDFMNRAVILPAREGRSMAIGMFAGRPITVVFAPLGSEAISIISMRIASRKERVIL